MKIARVSKDKGLFRDPRGKFIPPEFCLHSIMAVVNKKLIVQHVGFSAPEGICRYI